MFYIFIYWKTYSLYCKLKVAELMSDIFLPIMEFFMSYISETHRFKTTLSNLNCNPTAEDFNNIINKINKKQIGRFDRFVVIDKDSGNLQLKNAGFFSSIKQFLWSIFGKTYSNEIYSIKVCKAVLSERVKPIADTSTSFQNSSQKTSNASEGILTGQRNSSHTKPITKQEAGVNEQNTTKHTIPSTSASLANTEENSKLTSLKDATNRNEVKEAVVDDKLTNAINLKIDEIKRKSNSSDLGHACMQTAFEKIIGGKQDSSEPVNVNMVLDDMKKELDDDTPQHLQHLSSQGEVKAYRDYNKDMRKSLDDSVQNFMLSSRRNIVSLKSELDQAIKNHNEIPIAKRETNYEQIKDLVNQIYVQANIYRNNCVRNALLSNTRLEENALKEKNIEPLNSLKEVLQKNLSTDPALAVGTFSPQLAEKIQAYITKLDKEAKANQEIKDVNTAGLSYMPEAYRAFCYSKYDDKNKNESLEFQAVFKNLKKSIHEDPEIQSAIKNGNLTCSDLNQYERLMSVEDFEKIIATYEEYTKTKSDVTYQKNKLLSASNRMDLSAKGEDGIEENLKEIYEILLAYKNACIKQQISAERDNPILHPIVGEKINQIKSTLDQQIRSGLIYNSKTASLTFLPNVFDEICSIQGTAEDITGVTTTLKKLRENINNETHIKDNVAKETLPYSKLESDWKKTAQDFENEITKLERSIVVNKEFLIKVNAKTALNLLSKDAEETLRSIEKCLQDYSDCCVKYLIAQKNDIKYEKIVRYPPGIEALLEETIAAADKDLRPMIEKLLFCKGTEKDDSGIKEIFADLRQKINNDLESKEAKDAALETYPLEKFYNDKQSIKSGLEWKGGDLLDTKESLLGAANHNIISKEKAKSMFPEAIDAFAAHLRNYIKFYNQFIAIGGDPNEQFGFNRSGYWIKQESD
jgi:hypothetical protein